MKRPSEENVNVPLNPAVVSNGVARGTQAAAELDGVIAVNQRSVVLQFVVDSAVVLSCPCRCRRR